MPDQPVDVGYLSLRSLAAYSDLAVRTLRDYCNHPKHPMPHYRMDGKILVKRSEFEAWIRTFKVDDQTPPKPKPKREARRRPVRVSATVDEIMESLH